MDKLSHNRNKGVREPSGAVRSFGIVLADLPRRVLIALVQGYRYLLKPWLGNACRFEPTCSQYALDALRRHGALVGASLITTRLLRCHPWCQGGCDPVPEKRPGIFTRLGLGQVRPQHNPNDKEPSS